MRFSAAVNLYCGVLTTKAFEHCQAILANNESVPFVLAIRTSKPSVKSMLMPARASTPSITGTLRTRLISSVTGQNGIARSAETHERFRRMTYRRRLPDLGITVNQEFP